MGGVIRLKRSQIKAIKAKQYSSKFLNDNFDLVARKDRPQLKPKYLKNHQHDYSDEDAIKFDVSNDSYERVCGWCGKFRWRN